jgi:hypothetical protein
VSEENGKVAMARGGDFSIRLPGRSARIPRRGSHSLSEAAVSMASTTEAVARKLTEGQDSGQWWVYFVELQMPTAPEVFCQWKCHRPLAQGGSNFLDGDRASSARGCFQYYAATKTEEECPEVPQAVMPLRRSHQLHTHHGARKKHIGGRRPAASKDATSARRVKERKAAS